MTRRDDTYRQLSCVLFERVSHDLNSHSGRSFLGVVYLCVLIHLQYYVIRKILKHIEIYTDQKKVPFDTNMHESAHVPLVYYIYIYMNSGCVLECRPTSHYFYTYGNTLILSIRLTYSANFYAHIWMGHNHYQNSSSKRVSVLNDKHSRISLPLPTLRHLALHCNSLLCSWDQ